jgi:transposase
MMGRRTPYSEEFTQEAVKLVRDQRLRPAQAARDLGVGADTLRRWVDEAASDPEHGSMTPSSSTELVRLRRENEQLRMERDILKKALGIFSRMPQ